MKPRSMLILLLSAILLGACSGQAKPATIAMPAKATAAPSPVPIEAPTSEPTPTARLTATSTPLSRKPPEVTLWAPYLGFLEQQTLVDNAGPIGEVNFVWYELDAGGSITGDVQSPPGMEAARVAGLRIVPSIQNAGFNREAVAAIIHDPARRAQHVQDLVALVTANGFDGLDLDYESLNPEDRDDFSLFVEELAAALHARNKLLSIAVHPKTEEPGTWNGPQAQDYARLGAAVDEFKIMTYDYHWSTSEAGPIAPLDWVDQVLTFAATVVPPEKTYLGVPFYGYDWTGSTGEPLNWRQATKLASQNNAELQRDASSGEAWFTYGDGRHTVYFNDAETLRQRLQAAFERHPDLAGVAIWALGGEDPENWSVRSGVNSS